MTAGSSIAATRCIRPAQRGQRKTSRSTARCVRAAQIQARVAWAARLAHPVAQPAYRRSRPGGLGYASCRRMTRKDSAASIFRGAPCIAAHPVIISVGSHVPI